MKINIFNQTEENITNYEKVLKKIFKKLKDKKNINIILTTDEKIKRLNKEFRNIDKKTDVLSFINDEDPKSNGDIFISLETMWQQAKEYGHGCDREIGVSCSTRISSFKRLWPWNKGRRAWDERTYRNHLKRS